MKKVDENQITLVDIEGAVPPHTWIPVEYGMPKCGKQVLVYTAYDEMLVADRVEGNMWWSQKLLHNIEDLAIAWMPLPEPYIRSHKDD